MNKFEVGDLVVPLDDVSDTEQIGLIVNTYTSLGEILYCVQWLRQSTDYPYYGDEIALVSS